MGHVDSSQVTPLYANTTPGLTADANVFDPAIAALIVAINENFDSFEALKAAFELPVADQSVTTRILRNLAVTNPKLAPLAVTADKIADGTITTAKLADLVITAAKIADGTITEPKYATGSVSSRAIAPNSIKPTHLDPTILLPYESLAVKASFERMRVDVTEFGATGNGVTNDRYAIQAAIDSVSSGVIYFPPGVYRIEGLYPLGFESDYPARKEDGIRIKSNLVFEGDNATLRASANCAYIFTSHLEKDINSDEEAFHNITFRGLTLEKEVIPFVETRAFYHLINVETCINLLIENCKFKGWSGDAICIGTLAYADLSDWHKTVVRNVRIQNCDFDGVDNSNRQGISIVCGQDVFIDNCNFVRTTHTGMPGAIDIEPDRIHEYAGNIHISNCTFDMIGDGIVGGCVCFVMPDDLAYTANNFSVKNCTMKNSFRAIQVLGKRGGTEEALQASSPHTFEFSGNVINNCDYWFIIGGVDNVTLRNNNIDGIRFPSQIGSTDYAPLQQSVSRFYMDNNIVKNFIVTDGAGNAPILINGAILGGSITKNQFIDCGNRYSESSYELFRVFRTSFTKHKNLYIADNVFIKTGAIAFIDGETLIFQVDNPLSYGSTILMKDNNYVNIKTLRNIDFDMHRYARVAGEKGLVAQQNWFNSQSSYDDTVLPDSIPLGVTSSGTGDYTLITFKPGARDASRSLTVQLKADIATPSVLKIRKPDISTNTWGSWTDK